MERKQGDNKVEKEEDAGIDIEENVNSSHKPFLSRLYSKTTPIGFQYHQVFVPAWSGPALSRQQRLQQLQKRDIQIRPKPTFLASRVKSDELQEYLNFAQSYYEEKIPDYFTVGNFIYHWLLLMEYPCAETTSILSSPQAPASSTVSKERTRAKAMDFLHKMDYNYTKAKFYILFPYYLTYNSYRCHDPLSISLEDMQKKIKDHLDSLKNTKEKDMQKWVQTLESCLANRTKFQSFISLIEQGKQNKYQIPQHIKQHIQKSQKIGKQLRKSLQGNKLSIEALRAKKQMLDEYKLETPDMIAFEDSVTRCEEWIKKQEVFEQKYFELSQNGSYVLKHPEQKIQFRQIQLLVSEYNNLPLLCSEFETTTKSLHQKTIELLQNIPNINKIVKTRNAKQVTISKIPYKQMKDYVKLIEVHPVWHQDFSNFEINMRQSMELIQRMNMFLEDPLSQKNSKTLNNYIKLMADVQIQNNVEKRLRNRQQCNDIMQRIKKQISNPGKVEYIKQAFNKLRQKGNKEVEDLVYQKKIEMYIGWFESQQKLKEPKIIHSNIEILLKQLQISQKLVNAADYRTQLESAKRQWNISEQLIIEAYQKLQKNQQHVAIIRKMLVEPDPNLDQMLSILKECITYGLKFPEFDLLYQQVLKYFIDLAKIHSLLKLRPQNLDTETEKKFFFKPNESDYIISMVVYPQEMKILKTKEKAEQLLKDIKQTPFPRYLEQCKAFEEFMKKGQQWAQRVRQLIKNFTQLGDSIDIRELEDSRFYIHSKAIKDEIGKIQTIIRWRQKISKKLDDGRPQLFLEQQQTFLQQLQKDLTNFQSLQQGTVSFKQLYLEYSRENDQQIKRILYLITYESKIENICKLSEMNKFHRQIEKQNERHKIEDKKILELKEKFRDQIVSADDWKEKYLTIKRFQKKKITKKQDSENMPQNEELIGGEQNYMREGKQVPNNGHFDGGNELSPENNQYSHYRKKYTIKNGEFAWYFKFLIMILQFSKGYKLKFCLEQLSKLKNALAQIEKFISHYDKIFEKQEPFDTELANLDSEASKIQIFIRQIWLLKKKNAYVNSWRIIADSILDSVPIINMELKARKPQQLLTVLAHRKLQTQQAKKQTPQERTLQPNLSKRERKPNSYYFTPEITVFAEQNINSKPKKKKKGNNGDGEYRNTAVSSQVKRNARSDLLEEIQRTQAIIKAGVEAGTMAEDPKQYCICRYGQPNQNTTMVQCEGRCEQWFHIQCIGIKKHQAKSDNRYTCVGCSTLYDLKSTGAFYWDYHSKISEYALEEIVKQGRNLGIFTQQLKKVNIVYEKMVNWKKSVNELITNFLRDDFMGKDITVYKERLYEVYLLSLWLPTFHYQTSTIKRFLLFSREDKIEDVPL